MKAVLTRSGQHAQSLWLCQFASVNRNSFFGDPDKDSLLYDEITVSLSSLSCIHFDNSTDFFIKIYLGKGVWCGGEGK